MSKNAIALEVSQDEALVLFEWLAELDSNNSGPADGSAEQKVLWKLEGQLERLLVEPLESDYQQLVEEARRNVLATS
ncbi:MAG: hypothetical protein CMD39_06415 [Gammaproteobacteria bacterium]|nr:hypothetical protein [Gammaproteobacteria bacterium]|tara:strand:- start:5293 stop:5523 length:231 start_codon:yes stop_codon:yes gene_type:complete